MVRVVPFGTKAESIKCVNCEKPIRNSAAEYVLVYVVAPGFGPSRYYEGRVPRKTIERVQYYPPPEGIRRHLLSCK